MTAASRSSLPPPATAAIFAATPPVLHFLAAEASLARRILYIVSKTATVMVGVLRSALTNLACTEALLRSPSISVTWYGEHSQQALPISLHPSIIS